MKLNMEQRRIVELEPNGHMLVKGVAGSGKTTVAVRRIPFLLNHYCHEADDKVLLVTFNKTLVNYIKYQYNKVEDEEPNQIRFFDGIKKEVEISTIDSLMHQYYREYLKSNQLTLKTANSVEQYKALVQAIQLVSEKYPEIRLINSKYSSFLLDELAWLKACSIDSEDMYQNIDRTGRASGSRGNPQKLIKNSPLRAAIFELLTTYNRLLEKDGLIDFKEMNILALRQAGRAPITKYTHILIDESQDLTRIQLEFLKCIYQEKKYSSIMFIADNTQSIYSQSWLGKGRPYTTIGYDMSGKSRTLSKNYRTTTEISMAAYGLIEHDENVRNNLDFVKPSLIDRQGHPPIYKYFRTKDKELQFLFDEIRSLLNDYKHSDICIVARENRIIETAQKYLEDKGIPAELLNAQKPDFESDKVKLITFHSIKGLEFPVIFLIDINEGVIPNNLQVDYDDETTMESEERKLLYVGMTRANELLYISSAGKPSKFISEIEPDHLRLKRDCALRPYRSLGIYEYMLTDQIVDPNAREELVRQWVIKELHRTYGYPLEHLQLEYPVQQFSKKGFVDVAVNIWHQGRERPYIFTEIKQFGSGITDGLEQLKSYLAANEKVRYGVVTDGLEIMVIDREGNELNDIPRCVPQFLPDDKERKVYINFRTNKRFAYASETNEAARVEITDPQSNLMLDYINLEAVPIAGEVAAGMPITVNQQYDNFLYLPQEWLISCKETFALKVTGDSMNGIGIDKNDVVVVHHQNTAQNGDIIIAVNGQEATMKKFQLMGDTVLLLSENPKYEPIQMKLEDITINGKVIGVLKN
ncbi:MAG: transcriptional repressor LexA [Clostridiaceae bacterium]